MTEHDRMLLESRCVENRGWKSGSLCWLKTLTDHWFCQFIVTLASVAKTDVCNVFPTGSRAVYGDSLLKLYSFHKYNQSQLNELARGINELLSSTTDSLCVRRSVGLSWGYWSSRLEIFHVTTVKLSRAREQSSWSFWISQVDQSYSVWWTSSANVIQNWISLRS